MTPPSTPPPPAPPLRMRAFMDFWNFQLELLRVAGQTYRLDWRKLTGYLLAKVGQIPALVGGGQVLSFEEFRVYLSINPSSPKDQALRRWATTFLDRQPGVFVQVVERRFKGPPKCPACYRDLTPCPLCGQPTSGTVEKGVDTRIVTDMIRLAWEQSYEVSVVFSADRDFVPAAELLQAKGVKVIQVGMGLRGHELATKCWASVDISADLEALRRS